MKFRWVRLQRAHLLERLEKVEEALEVASQACQLLPHPFYRPGVQADGSSASVVGSQ